MTMHRKLACICLIVCLSVPCCISSPSLGEMLSFVNSIEKHPGGGELLKTLIAGSKGIKEEQLKQVMSLLPLLDAKHGHPSGGFIQLMQALDSTTSGHKLLHSVLDQLTNISNTRIQDINELVPVVSGSVNRSHGASLIEEFISGPTGREVLTGLLGDNSSIPIDTVENSLADILETESVIDALKLALTPGDSTNTILLEVVDMLGDVDIEDDLKTLMPIVRSIISIIGSESENETIVQTTELLHNMNDLFQNVSLEDVIGPGIADIYYASIKSIFDMLQEFETVDDIYNITLYQEPLNAFLTIINNLNSTLLQASLGNSSFTNLIVDIVNNSESIEELILYLMEEWNMYDEVVGGTAFNLMKRSLNFLETLVDDPTVIQNMSLEHTILDLIKLVEDLNATRLENTFGNSTFIHGFVNLVEHANTDEELRQYLLHLILHELDQPGSHVVFGELIGRVSLNLASKGYETLLAFVNDPDILSDLTFEHPMTDILSILQNLNITKINIALGNHSWTETIDGIIENSYNVDNITMYLLRLVLQETQKLSSLKWIGRYIASKAFWILGKGLDMIESVVDDHDVLEHTSVFNPVRTMVTFIYNINITKLEQFLGNSSLARVITKYIREIQSPWTVLRHLIYNPRVLNMLSLFINGTASSAMRTAATLLSSSQHEFNLSIRNVMALFQNANMTQLELNLDNSSFSEMVLAVASALKSEDGLSESKQECARDLDTVIRGLTQLDIWALQMLDASGKPGPSVLEGAVKLFGNYDECLAISTPLLTEDGSKRDLRGNYCRLVFLPPQALLDKTGILDTPVPLPEDFLPSLEWHLCLPQSCDDKTLASLLALLPLEAVNTTLYKVECDENTQLSHDTKAIVAVCIMAVFVLLTVLGTLYDGVTGEMHRIKRKYGEDEDDMKGSGIAAYDDNFSIKKSTGGTNGIAMVSMNGVKVHHYDMADGDNISTSTQPYEPDSDYEEIGVCRRMLLAFSFCRNTERIFNTDKKRESIDCIHGIRVLSMAGIVLGQVIIYTFGVTVENGTKVLERVKDFGMQPVVNATLDVDTFFLIGGCLVAYLFVTQVKKAGRLTGRHMLVYYVHRFWRLWPVYLVVLMLYTCLMSHVLDGPLRTDGLDYDNKHCANNWWTNVLFINNVYKTDEMCMGWTWFTATNMQFYIIAPLALVPLVLGLPAVGIIVMVLMFIVQIVTYAYKEYYINGTILTNVHEFEQGIYFMPWCRVGVFAMGLLLGYTLTKTKKIHIPRFMLVLGWQLCLAVGLLCLFVTWDEWRHGHLNWSRDVRLAYETLSRPAWALFISWIIFVCATGHGGFVNRFLSWSAWVPLGRLTYGAYLIHPILITYSDFHKRSLAYVDCTYIIYQFLGTFCLAYFFSYVITVLVEAPCMALEVIALRKLRK